MSNMGKRTFALLREERGAIAVETGMYFVVFSLLCALLVDFSAVFLNKSQLERVNHSLASVLRERTVFYEAREALTQADFNALNGLAGALLAGSRLADNYQLSVSVVHFQDSANKNQKNVASTQSFTTGAAGCRSTAAAITSPQLKALSPWAVVDGAISSSQRWLPVYQVTLCVPGGESLFKRIIGLIGETTGDISVSDAVIPR